ncbi:GNAT family N-acetyltransferase [Roseibium sp. SCPC15]|uniref:GNAT family N-acetyltransferase n=1 Tax=Roseibium sp. SCP15 TaxID=3141376 RepID=UPI003339A469
MAIAEQTSETGFQVKSHSSLPANWPSGNDETDVLCHIFQTREFVQSWEESYGKTGKHKAIYVEVLGDDGSLWLQIPFCIETRGRLRVLTFLDQGHADYNCPIFHPNAPAWTNDGAAELWLKIIETLPDFDIAHLEKVAPGYKEFENPLFLISDDDSAEFCHGNDLTKSWQEIEATQFNLKTLKRYGRRLQELGETRLEIARTQPEAQEMLERLIVQKQRRFEETLVPTFKENPTALVFLDHATRNFGKSGNLFLVSLFVGDTQAASTWSLSHRGCLYSLIMGFEDGVYRKYSSGRILNLKLLQWLKDNGYEYLDHGFGDEDYKVKSCDTTVRLKEALIPITNSGRLFLLKKNGMARLRSTGIWQKFRPYKWKVINKLREISDRSAN